MGEWGFRLYRFGTIVCARLTMLRRHSKVFRTWSHRQESEDRSSSAVSCSAPETKKPTKYPWLLRRWI